MDFKFKGQSGNKCENNNVENEYHLELKIETLELAEQSPKNVQIILIFGDLVNKMDANDIGTFDGEYHEYILHSVPSALAKKLLELPIMVYIVEKEEMKPFGSILLEVNECFANAIKCGDFRSESLKKVYELKTGAKSHGKITFYFNVTKNVGNGNRHRRFYTESTKEHMLLEKMLS